MKALLCILILLGVRGDPPREAPRGESEGLIDLILDMVSDSGELPWAKPVRKADLDPIMELVDRGVLALHPAEWSVPVGEEGDV